MLLSGTLQERLLILKVVIVLVAVGVLCWLTSVITKFIECNGQLHSQNMLPLVWGIVLRLCRCDILVRAWIQFWQGLYCHQNSRAHVGHADVIPVSFSRIRRTWYRDE